jgi:hypothetical protein
MLLMPIKALADQRVEILFRTSLRGPFEGFVNRLARLAFDAFAGSLERFVKTCIRKFGWFSVWFCLTRARTFRHAL